MNRDAMRSIQCIIMDLDGVLWSGDGPMLGSVEALHMLRSTGRKLRFLTNDAFNSRADRIAEMSQYGFDIDLCELFTAASLAAEYLRSLGNPRVMTLTGGSALGELSDLQLVEEGAEVVVVGDYFDSYDRKALEKAFGEIVAGADLVVMQRNRYYIHESRPRIDAGFWVAGLEYCTGVEAKLVGKPAIESYEMVLKHADATATESVMVSDDQFSDLVGAKKAGLTTVHVNAATVPAAHAAVPPADLTVSTLLHFAQLFAR